MHTQWTINTNQLVNDVCLFSPASFKLCSFLKISFSWTLSFLHESPFHPRCFAINYWVDLQARITSDRDHDIYVNKCNNCMYYVWCSRQHFSSREGGSRRGRRFPNQHFLLLCKDKRSHSPMETIQLVFKLLRTRYFSWDCSLIYLGPALLT